MMNEPILKSCHRDGFLAVRRDVKMADNVQHVTCSSMMETEGKDRFSIEPL